MSWSINSTDVAPFASLLFVSLFPPLTKRFSPVLILLALDISLLFTFEHAETPTFPTLVDPATETQAFTWKITSNFTLRMSFAEILIRASQTLLSGSHIFPEQYNTSPRILSPKDFRSL